MSGPFSINGTTGTTITSFAVGPRVRGPSLPGRLPVWKPPYSRITAIDMNTGEHLWWIPVGDTQENILNNPLLEGVDFPENTGNGQQATQIVTANMLIYSGSASDRTPMLYAVDKATGDRLAQIEMPVSTRYGMMTYMHGGEQYIVVQASNNLTALKLQ